MWWVVKGTNDGERKAEVAEDHGAKGKVYRNKLIAR